MVGSLRRVYLGPYLVSTASLTVDRPFTVLRPKIRPYRGRIFGRNEGWAGLDIQL